tara:strand:- start:1906 stop:2013 length:108 start_codon:yes stop_codon:yes gene_type:complete
MMVIEIGLIMKEIKYGYFQQGPWLYGTRFLDKENV